MKHLCSVTKKSPAVAGISLGDLTGPWGWGPAFWTPAVFGQQINEIGDFVSKWTEKATDVVD